jgi:hypothetical protein
MKFPAPTAGTIRRLNSGRCQVLDIGIAGYAECLLGGPNTCRHAMPFGYAFLCCYPEKAIRREDSPLAERQQIGHV